MWYCCLLFRGCSGLCVGIILIGLTLEDLKLTMKENKSVTFIQKTVGLANKDVLKNLLFWLTCSVYFFYQWGNLFIDSIYTCRPIYIYGV